MEQVEFWSIHPPSTRWPCRLLLAAVQSSLHTRSEMRAWFDDAVKYQFVRQERIPRQLPQVLVLNCGLKVRRHTTLKVDESCFLLIADTAFVATFTLVSS